MQLEKEKGMSSFDRMLASWHSWQLDVPSVQFRLPTDDMYEYKLPYTVASAPCCARISPMLYCFDVWPCCPCSCIPQKTGQLPFIDVVDQDSGHQVRHRSVKLCCRTPRVMTFTNGQYMGRANRTMRCGNKCLTCLEDIQKQPVLQVGLHDKNNNRIARIDREGRGCCCICKPEFPMKCTGCCLTCITCTCAAKPSVGSPDCGFCDCDPVCCDWCVKGTTTFCSLYDCPCLCIGCPAGGLACWCCWPTLETTRFPNSGTVKYQDFDVVDEHTGQPVGRMQALYRGNYPSAFTHDENTAFRVTAHGADGRIGMLLSSVAAGMVYTMGGPKPPFAAVTAKPKGRSPGYAGWVESETASQMKKLVEEALGEDLVVKQSMVCGPALNGIQTQGWKLVEMGFASSSVKFCGCGFGGKSRSPRPMKTLQQAKDMVRLALEYQIGEYGTQFTMKFECPDHEKQVVAKGSNVHGELMVIDKAFNPPRQGYIAQMESVELSCTCHRVCKGCCDTKPDKVFCCRLPLYAQEVGNAAHVVPEAWAVEAPAPRIMTKVPKQQFMMK